VKDGYDETTTGKVYTGIKAGFIYRKDKVEPYLPSSSPYTESFWMYRLRVQPFRELASGELFSLSMNHFKARSDAESQALRMENAGYLISYLEDIKYDPDILIMGDLNATTDSPEIQKLVSAGYEEQLAKYDPSGCWNIDHIMANSYMADQITGAASYCISYSGSLYRYSDHNAFVVGLNLAKSEVSTAVDQAEMTSHEPVAQKVLIGNSFFILRGEHMYDSQGRMLK
jgi:predicted extracellular nuclease